MGYRAGNHYGPSRRSPAPQLSVRTAAAIRGDPGVQSWLARLSPEEHDAFVEGLPTFVWGLDALTK